MRRRRRRDAGFTMIELLVALVIFAIGVAGIVAMQTTMSRTNRVARGLDRAAVYAAQVLESLRGKDPATLSNSGTASDVVTSDGVTFHRSYTVAGVTGSPTMVLITATATFVDDADGSTHSTSMNLVRTTREKL